MLFKDIRKAKNALDGALVGAKYHLSENRNAYISGAAGFAAGLLGTLVIRSKPVNITINNNIGPCQSQKKHAL